MRTQKKFKKNDCGFISTSEAEEMNDVDIQLNLDRLKLALEDPRGESVALIELQINDLEEIQKKRRDEAEEKEEEDDEDDEKEVIVIDSDDEEDIIIIKNDGDKKVKSDVKFVKKNWEIDLDNWGKTSNTVVNLISNNDRDVYTTEVSNNIFSQSVESTPEDFYKQSLKFFEKEEKKVKRKKKRKSKKSILDYYDKTDLFIDDTKVKIEKNEEEDLDEDEVDKEELLRLGEYLKRKEKRKSFSSSSTKSKGVFSFTGKKKQTKPQRKRIKPKMIDLSESSSSSSSDERDDDDSSDEEKNDVMIIDDDEDVKIVDHEKFSIKKRKKKKDLNSNNFYRMKVSNGPDIIVKKKQEKKKKPSGKGRFMISSSDDNGIDDEVYNSDPSDDDDVKNLRKYGKCLDENEEIYTTQEETPFEMKSKGTLLKFYQKMALSWMIEKEKEAKGIESKNEFFQKGLHYKSRGGILADEMGLGKTITTIALLLKVKRWPTLIVCPPVLIDQWKKEIMRHSRGINVYAFHGHNRNKNKEFLLNYHVVITSYDLVSLSFPQLNKRGVLEPIRKKVLLQIDWERVVLDEAHYCRNPPTRKSKACRSLKRKVAWCLTGTPIQNRVRDIWPLLNLIKMEKYSEESTFRREIIDRIKRNPENGFSFFRKVLRNVMLRRTKSMDINGKKVLDSIPERIFETIPITLNNDERETYDNILKKTQVKYNKYFNHESVLKNYVQILSMLLRLRQCCNHPYLLREDKDNVEKKASNEIYGKKKKKKKKIKFKSLDIDDSSDSSSSSSSSDDYSSSKKSVEEKSSEEENPEKGKLLCPICGEVKGEVDRIYTKCSKENPQFHTFCIDCIKKVKNETANSNSCPVCRTNLNWNDIENQIKEKNKQTEINKIELQAKLRKKWHESSKCSEMIKRLKKDLRDTDDKILIISQWTEFLDIIEVPILSKLIRKKKWRNLKVEFSRLDGKSSIAKRNDEIESIKRSRFKRIILVSMHACGVGLNLNFANRVYLMDHWWNPAAEAQAIDRVYRIGQTKKTFVFRFLVKNSIEEKVMGIKKRKQAICDQSYGNNAIGQNFVDKRPAKEDIYDLLFMGDNNNERRFIEMDERDNAS